MEETNVIGVDFGKGEDSTGVKVYPNLNTDYVDGAHATDFVTPQVLNAESMAEQGMTVAIAGRGSAVTVEQARNILGAHEQINLINTMRDEMKKNKLQVLGNDDLAQKISDKISHLNPAAIAALTDEQVREFYTDENGEMEFDLEMTKGHSEIEFKRDFLVYLRETDIADKSFDEQMDTLQASIKEYQDELNTLLSDYGDLSAFMRSKLQEEYDAAAPERKEKLLLIMDAYDDSYTLDRVLEHFQKFGRNVLNDYKHRPDALYKKFVKATKELKLKADFSAFNNVEKNFLEEKYQQYPNLFMFLVIKMYAQKKDLTNNVDGVFLSQVAVNLKSLYANSFGSEEKKQGFLNAIRKVLDLFVEDAE